MPIGQRRQGAAEVKARRGMLESPACLHCHEPTMIELNPVRQRIADLTDRVVSLRGYL
ncbi:hypothetical protein STPYR_11088 [uncultured Stenotrophomonas sp.]|uniref:Uncharacterized protein n=1 Tax=uncultured Stenotrophomonas sp. TaxID=165438 RepID=A0A1Y5Q1I6_9GAMM|nr:hypothetical protein STPYR_11088 [uncultured Stenotrophomonas sp.]